MSLGIAALVALGATVALGLTLPKTVEQAEYSRLIAIHPAIAWTAYVGASVTALASILWLWPRTRHPRWDLVAGASAEIATLFTALMLVTGSIWGRPTWGVWWVWDARLTLTAILLAVDLGYLALRRGAAGVAGPAGGSARVGGVLSGRGGGGHLSPPPGGELAPESP